MPNDANGRADVFVHLIDESVTARISVSIDGDEGVLQSVDPAISGDGSVVAFRSLARFLVPEDSNTHGDIFQVVLDSDIPPAIADQTLEVSEGNFPEAAVGTVVAEDGDDDAIRFTITGGDDGAVFSLDEESGEMTLARSVDFETTPSYALTVLVEAADGSDTATVTVEVLDVAVDFIDVAGSVFIKDIEWLAEVGITRGCNPPHQRLVLPGRQRDAGTDGGIPATGVGLTPAA